MGVSQAEAAEWNSLVLLTATRLEQHEVQQLDYVRQHTCFLVRLTLDEVTLASSRIDQLDGV